MLCDSGDIPQKMIILKNYTFSYPDGRNIFKGLNLEIPQGECFGIIGANGAGKTTLLFSLVGILKGNGKIIINNIPLNKKTLKKIRKEMGFVFQDPNIQLFSPTVFDDVAFGPINMGLSPDIVQERVKKALSQVGLSGYENRLSYHLSMGEKKRVALATVLSMNPSILLLDEPSSGLDPRARREMIKLIQTLSGTKIIATHDLDMVSKLCNRVGVLYKGNFVWIGPPNKLLYDTKKLESFGL